MSADDDTLYTGAIATLAPATLPGVLIEEIESAAAYAEASRASST